MEGPPAAALSGVLDTLRVMDTRVSSDKLQHSTEVSDLKSEILQVKSQVDDLQRASEEMQKVLNQVNLLKAVSANGGKNVRQPKILFSTSGLLNET